MSVVTQQKVTEGEMEFGNEIEIFITLIRYYTRQQPEEGKPPLVVYYLISILTSILQTCRTYL